LMFSPLRLDLSAVICCLPIKSRLMGLRLDKVFETPVRLPGDRAETKRRRNERRPAAREIVRNYELDRVLERLQRRNNGHYEKKATN
jgi:hypothetical protein